MHETLLLGSRNALHTTEHAETQKIAIWRPRPGDPLTMSHFGPPDSIRRRVGRLPARGGTWPRVSEPATRARPSGALEKGKKGLSTPSEVPSVTPVRGEGKFEGEGGFSAPPSPSRQKWLQRRLPGSLEGAAQAKAALPSPNLRCKHIWANNALQTRILSIRHSSSAEPEGFGTPNPIKQVVSIP